MDQDIVSLYQKYISRNCTSEELEKVLSLIEEGKFQREWDTVITNDAAKIMHTEAEFDNDLDETRLNTLHDRIISSINKTPEVLPLRKNLWTRIAAAAAILIVTGFSLFYYQQNRKKDQANQVVKQAIIPGGNKASLTLANGQKISLTDAANGTIANQGVAAITKTANGKLVYSILNTDHNKPEKLVYNTVETPKGGQYNVKLPDGTEVWLNAASSIKYPISFTAQKNRIVELTGEAYFEVAKDKIHAFIVKSNEQNVEVLGTHFNISAYDDESVIKTTLLEGRVEVSRNHSQAYLNPGDQSQTVSDPSKNITISKVNVNDAIAWKNGLFQFDNSSIQEAMRQAARWYDVDVRYAGALPQRHFKGNLPRSSSFKDFLDQLSYTGVHFRIEGRTVVVIP